MCVCVWSYDFNHWQWGGGGRGLQWAISDFLDRFQVVVIWSYPLGIFRYRTSVTETEVLIAARPTIEFSLSDCSLLLSKDWPLSVSTFGCLRCCNLLMHCGHLDYRFCSLLKDKSLNLVIHRNCVNSVQKLNECNSKCLDWSYWPTGSDEAG